MKTVEQILLECVDLLTRLEIPDLGDIQDVIFMQGQLDEAYMHGWAIQLNVADHLEKALNNS